MKALLFLLLLVLGSFSEAAVVFDNSSSETAANGTTAPASAGTLTTPAFTIGSGSNRAFIVAVTCTQSGIAVSSVTVGGVSATSVGTRVINGSAWVHLFYGVAPASGSQTASVTYDDTWGTNLGIMVATYEGVDQTTPVDTGTYATGTGSTTPATATVTGTTTGNLVASAIHGVSTGDLTVTTGTERGLDSIGVSEIRFGDQDGASGSVSWTLEFNDVFALAAVELNAASGGSSIVPIIMQLH